MSCFAYFNEDTGEVKEITSEKDSTRLYIEIDDALATSFLNATESMLDWVVTSDSDNKYVISKKQKNKKEVITNNSIFPLKTFNKIQETQDVFQVIQRGTKWLGYASLTNECRDFYKRSKDYFGQYKVLYVTEKGDKRKLLETISVDFENFFTDAEFEIQAETFKDCDLYIASGNDNFIHVRCDNDHEILY